VTVALLSANVLFVAAEFALLTSRRHRLEQLAADGRPGAAALAGVRELSLMLAAAQLGITMASLGLGIIGEPAIAHALEPLLETVGLPAGVSYVIASAIALSIVMSLHMVVGEMMSSPGRSPTRRPPPCARPGRSAASRWCSGPSCGR